VAYGGTLTGRAWRGGKSDWRMHALSVFSLAVAFVCLCSALLVVVNLEAVRSRWARVGRMTVYLKQGADAASVRELRAALDATQGVKHVRFVSPDEARRELVTDSADSALASLPAEAFSASLEIDFQPQATDNAIVHVGTTLKRLPAVDGVETYARWSEKLAHLLRGGVIASSLLAIVVFGAVVSVVGSTMRMALERRRVEVEVLKLVGATDRYVRGPYVLEGAMQGVLGATGALILLGILYAIVRSRFDVELAMLFGIQPTFLPWFMMVGLMGLGAGLGAASSYLSLQNISNL
jgi:cell division transport system permease protein